MCGGNFTGFGLLNIYILGEYKGIFIALFLMLLLSKLVSKEQNRQLIQMYVGILLVCMMLSPVVRWFGEDISENMMQEWEKYEQSYR